MEYSLTDNQIQSKINKYIKEQNENYQTNEATEYTYRTPLTNLLNTLMPNRNFFMESKHIGHNAPDYSIKLKNKKEPMGPNIGHLETKLPGANLNSPAYSKQFNRYKSSFQNVIFTDYLHFEIYENGSKKNPTSIRIARAEDGQITATTNALSQIKKLMAFIEDMKIPEITSGLNLANKMANQAKIMADSTSEALNEDKSNNNVNTPLLLSYKQFKHDLLKNLSLDKFADYVAQTITYGMFAARIYDKRDKHFSADTAAEKIPNTDPFLKRLFNSMIGVNADDRIKWCINMLADTFKHVNVDKVLRRFSHKDPIFHFYEDFLQQYNPDIKKSRGVWYTNANICHFIISSIDWLLQKKLGITEGLASTLSIKKNGKLIPKVQILDPATGTGTFLSETVKQMKKHFIGDEGLWPSFVQNQLINRLNAFEILMVPYTIAHLKLLSTIKNTTNTKLDLKNKQFNIYLADALAKPAEKKPGKLASKIDNYIKLEKDKSDRVKDSLPVMVVLGNPPYSGMNSVNNGSWIEKLLNDYKKNLHDPSIKAVNDDYVKFIRIAEEYVTNNGYGKGIIGYITNSTYLTSPACRVMRKNLAKNFDDIYILDLHGSSYDHRTKQKKVNNKNITIKDENVFNTQTAVAISFFVKDTNKPKHHATIHYTDKINNIQMVDSRRNKLRLLGSHNISQLKFKSWKFPIHAIDPTFIPLEKIRNNHYKDKNSISLYNAFNVKEHGILTGNDNFTVKPHYNQIDNLLNLFKNDNFPEIVKKFPHERAKNDKSNRRKWSLQKAFNDIKHHDADVIRLELRPLDYQYTIMTSPSYIDKKKKKSRKSGNSDGFLMWPRWKSSKLLITSHVLTKEKTSNSLALILPRQVTKAGPYHHAIVSNCPINNRVLSLKRGGGFQFPIRGPKSISGFKDGKPILKYYSNFSRDFIIKLSKILGPQYKQPDKTHRINILAWIIGILWTPQYIHKYGTRLKKDFARIPLPHSINDFSKIIKIGHKLINAFILKDTKDNNIKFPKTGNMKVSTNSTQRKYKNGKLFFNKTQYFQGVTPRQYKFTLGGFQILKKWFQDRKGSTLDINDVIKLKEIIGAINIIIKCQRELGKLQFLNKY